MFNDQKQYLQLFHITSDIVCLSVFYYILVPVLSDIATWFSFPLFEKIAGTSPFYKTSLYFKLSPVFIVSPLLLLFLKGYQDIGVQKFKTIFYQTFALSFITTGILSVIFIVLNFSLKLNMFLPIVFGFVLWLILVLNRFYISFLVKKSSSNQNLIRHILIVGADIKAHAMSKHIMEHPECGLQVTGFLTSLASAVGKKFCDKKVLGSIRDLPKVINNQYVDCVFYIGENDYSQYHDFIVTTCSIQGIDFATVEPELLVNELNGVKIFQETINNIPIRMVKFVYRNPRLSFLKRIFDFTVSAVLIGVCLPPWITIAISIKMTSPGPILFRQERIGKHGKKFILYKFRSMVDNAEKLQEELIHLNEMDGPAFKIKDDPRQTVTGRFLRRTSLDELPQLFNVLKGDISLVGPRPAIEKEVSLYRPWERKRLSVEQGITCIWQISGRSNIKFDEWMKLDLMYIDHWSPALDYKILFETVPAILLKKGAY